MDDVSLSRAYYRGYDSVAMAVKVESLRQETAELLGELRDEVGAGYIQCTVGECRLLAKLGNGYRRIARLRLYQVQELLLAQMSYALTGILARSAKRSNQASRAY